MLKVINDKCRQQALVESSWDRGKANWSLLLEYTGFPWKNTVIRRDLQEKPAGVSVTGSEPGLIQVHVLLLYSHSSEAQAQELSLLAGASQGSGWREDKANDGLWKRCQLCHAECLHLSNSSHWLQGLADHPVCPILLPGAFTAWGQREFGAMATSAMWLLPFISSGKAKPKKMRF